MKCVICKVGDLQPGTATITLTRDALTFVVKHVPAQICSNCVGAAAAEHDDEPF